ncbi:perforin-1-like [Clarias gariepinus]|uniref:perforin-1-like n=1 Tax=Clarias gariepinus TaxID=13013 RepID=UPI00234D2B09|nr:perforin-1-like [Clarias gariepinus]
MQIQTMMFFSSPQLVYLTVFLLACLAFPSDALLRVYGMNGKGLDGDVLNPPEPYVKVFVRNILMGQTYVINSSSNPTWSTNVVSSTAKVNDEVKLQVWDKDIKYDDLLGTCYATVRSGINSFRCSLSKGGTLSYMTEFH